MSKFTKFFIGGAAILVIAIIVLEVVKAVG